MAPFTLSKPPDNMGTAASQSAGKSQPPAKSKNARQERPAAPPGPASAVAIASKRKASTSDTAEHPPRKKPAEAGGADTAARAQSRPAPPPIRLASQGPPRARNNAAAAAPSHKSPSVPAPKPAAQPAGSDTPPSTTGNESARAINTANVRTSEGGLPRIVADKFNDLNEDMRTIKSGIPQRLPETLARASENINWIKEQFALYVAHTNGEFKILSDAQRQMRDDFTSHIAECQQLQSVPKPRGKRGKAQKGDTALQNCVRATFGGLMADFVKTEGSEDSALLPTPLPPSESGEPRWWDDEEKKVGLHPGWELSWPTNSDKKTGWTTPVVQQVKSEGPSYYTAIALSDLEAASEDEILECLQQTFSSYVTRFKNQTASTDKQIAIAKGQRERSRKVTKSNGRGKAVASLQEDGYLGPEWTALGEVNNVSTDESVYGSDPEAAAENAILSDNDSTPAPALKVSQSSKPSKKPLAKGRPSEPVRYESRIPSYRAPVMEEVIQLTLTRIPRPKGIQRVRTGKVKDVDSLPVIRGSTQPNAPPPNRLARDMIKPEYLAAHTNQNNKDFLNVTATVTTPVYNKEGEVLPVLSAEYLEQAQETIEETTAGETKDAADGGLGGDDDEGSGGSQAHSEAADIEGLYF